MTRPNFFIVGEPKSGTTAFYEYLRTHPQIFAPERKEVHYFCRDIHEENARIFGAPLHFPIRTESDYLALFQGWNGEPLVGEASVNYLASTVAAREIHRFDPSAKILVFLRNPVDFLYSWHAHSLLTNGEVIESFEEALDAEAARREGRMLTSLAKVPSYLFYSERVRYADHIRRYLEYFPREQVKVIIYEDFVADREGVYRDLLRFLGADPAALPDFQVINARKRLRLAGLARFTKRPAVRRALGLLAPKPLRRALGLPALYRRIFLVRERGAPMREETRRMLVERFRPEVEEVSELLGRDLVALWGFDRAAVGLRGPVSA